MKDLAAPVSGAALPGQNDLMGSMLDHVAALDSNADFASVLSTIRTTASRGALKVGLENVTLNPEVGRNLNASDSSSLLSHAFGAALEVSNLFNQSHYRSTPKASGHVKTVPVVNNSVKDPLTGAVEGAALVGAEDIKINFQPSTSTVPTGYTKDVGEAYNNTRGYGWVQAGTNTPLDITLYARDRNRTGIDPRLNTLLHMQYSNTTPAAWEYALPDGQYNVTIGVGDQANARGMYDSQHTINVEGAATAINRFQGNATQEYKQATVQADVSDGKLTIDAIGGTNTKINYVDIARVTSPGSNFTKINWSTVAPSSIGRSEAMGAVVDGKLYTFGGFTDTTYTPARRADVYDPASNMWRRIQDLPKGLTNAGTAVDEVNNDIYLAGGYVEQADGTGQVFGTQNVWKYDVETDTWTAITSLPQARGAGELSLLNGELHFFGGTNIKRVDQSSHWVLSLDGGTRWTSAASLPESRNQLGDAVLDGKLYAIGGQRGQNEAAVTQTSVYKWNPTASAWTEVTNLPRARSHIGGATFVMDGRIIIAGGKTNQANVSAVTAYDPLSDSWTELTPLPTARKSGVAGKIGNQIFYTMGNGFKSTTYKGVPDN